MNIGAILKVAGSLATVVTSVVATVGNAMDAKNTINEVAQDANKKKK